MAFAELAGVRLHYELTGDAPLPVLILSNPLGVNLSVWDSQMPAFAPHFRILRYDARGHGQSSTPAGPYSIAHLGQDLLALLDALSLQQASFCGLSMGGSTGQWLALHAPGRLHKLVLANTAARIGKEEVWNTRIATVQQEGLGAVIPGTQGRWFTEEFRSLHPQTVAHVTAMLEAMQAEGYIAACAAVRDADFRDNLAAIRTPTLVITGSHDPVTPPEDAQFLAAHIPGAKYVELPVAHLSNVAAAEAFNAALVDFLLA